MSHLWSEAVLATVFLGLIGLVMVLYWIHRR